MMRVLKHITKPGLANICKTTPWYGSEKAKVVVVVDPIVFADESTPPSGKYPINKAQLRYISPMLKAATLTKDDVLFISACPPCSKSTWHRDKRLNDHLKENRNEFIKALDLVKPKLIIASGKCAIRQVTGRSVKITKVRGVPYQDEAFDTLVLPLLGIYHTMLQPDNLPLFKADWETAGRVIKAGYRTDYEEKTKTNYKWVNDLDFLVKLAKAGKLPIIGVDTEGKGLRPYQDDQKLYTVQIAWGPGKAVAIPMPQYPHKIPGIDQSPLAHRRRLKQLRFLLEHAKVRKVGHNFKFDWLVFHYRLGIDTINYSDDTIMLVHMLDENQLSKDLKDSVRRFVPPMSGYSDKFDSGVDKTRMEDVAPDDLMQYGCGDADASLRLYHVLAPKLKKDIKNYRCYRRVVMPAMRAFCYIEPEGFTIDRRELNAFRIMLTRHQAKEYTALINMIPTAIKDKFKDTGVGLKLTRDLILRDMLFLHPKGLGLTPIVFTKTGLPSVSSKQHLPYFVTEHPFVPRILDYIKNAKMLGTYVGLPATNDTLATGFYKYIVDGKIRPSYMLHRTVTGRSASNDPNGQNFPKRGKFAKQYRKIFVAPFGHVLLEADYSQVELRIAAIMAMEKTMLAIYAKGGDVHRATAAAIMKLTLEQFLRLPLDTQDFRRFQAKAVNFGFLYGMWWRKFKRYAKTEYGIDLTDAQAEEHRELFFNLYHGFESWHRAVEKFAMKHGFVRAIDGRVRHVPSAFSADREIAKRAVRQAINAPVQGFGSDLGLMALARITRMVKKELVRIIGFIHDALVAIAPINRAVEAARVIKRYMETNPLEKWFGFKSPIPLPAEVSIGFNLAEMVELKDKVIGNENVKSVMDVVRELRKVLPTIKDKKAREAVEGNIIKLMPKPKLVVSNAPMKPRIRLKLVA